ncbi:hypothetical protein DESUT3_32980 [Desulfuromonas versatilis]|uniref:Nudix hydrolase domain-containing protein n=1 Tax=Desulfuromonas versatilis TaxID=2802975 RepID=A0ABN6E3V3_9BACT|nr:NUDIX hydrolase [Desulfuromonas versatilis]BCR06229.1 hypothetical protein DESUT3_32980 [Desulfuromonas versatilis]
MEHPKHVVVVGCLIRNRAGEVLLIRHPRRGWEIPQGRVEEGEDLVAAAHREVLEEAGVEMNLGPLAAVWSMTASPASIIFNFLADYRGGELRPSEESLELGWFSAEEALGYVTHPVNLDRLRTLLAYSGSVVYRAYAPKPYQVQVEAVFSSI